MPGLLPPFLRRNMGSWLYRFWARGVAWGRTRQRLETYTLYVTLAVCLVTWMGLVMSWGNDWEGGFVLAGAVAFLLFPVVDFAAVYFGIVTVNEQLPQMDLLRLSPLPGAQLAEVLHQVTQTRAWRVLVVMQAVRLTLVGVALTFGMGIVLISVVFTFGVGLVLIAALGLLALSEPIWRLELMAAVGVAAGVRGASASAQWGLGLGVMVLVWVVQGVVGTVPLWMMRLADDSSFAFIVGLGVSLPGIAFVIWWGQTRLRDWCLSMAGEHIETAI